MENDRELLVDVLDEIRWELRVNATDIGAAVQDGEVTIEGTVDSFAEKLAAERAIMRLPEVKSLTVRIEVKPPGYSERTAEDIAREVDHALDWSGPALHRSRRWVRHLISTCSRQLGYRGQAAPLYGRVLWSRTRKFEG
jgi:hypothetical protein